MLLMGHNQLTVQSKTRGGSLYTGGQGGRLGLQWDMKEWIRWEEGTEQFRWTTASAKGQRQAGSVGNSVAYPWQKPSRWLNPIGVLFSFITWCLTIGNSGLVEWLFNAIRDLISFSLSVQPSGAHGFSLHGFHLCIHRGQPLHLSLFKKKGKDKVAYWQNLPPFRKLPKQHHPETSAFSWKCVTWPFPAPPDASTSCVHHHPEQNEALLVN